MWHARPARLVDRTAMRRRLSAPSAPAVATAVPAMLVVVAMMLAPGPQTDLGVYRWGGEAVWHGTTLYDVRVPHSHLAFTYPPFAALVFAPFGLFPLGLVEVVWCALTVWGLVSLLQAVRLAVVPPPPLTPVAAPVPGRGAAATKGRRVLGVVRQLSVVRQRSVVRVLAALRELAVVRQLSSMRTLLWAPWALPLLVVAALATEPVRSTISLGQVNVLVVLAIWTDNRPSQGRLPGGVLTGIVAAIKLTPLVFVPYLWFTGRRKAASWAVATFLAAHAAAFGLAPAASRAYWGGLFVDASRIGTVTFAGNQSLYGAMARTWGDTASAAHLYRLALVVVAAAGLTLAVRLHRQGLAVAGLCTCAVTGLLASPISWSHHWLWAIPVLLWLACDREAPPWGPAVSFAGYVLFVVCPVWWTVPDGQSARLYRDLAVLATKCYTIAAVVFLAAMGSLVGRTGRHPLWHPRAVASASADPPGL